jgi:hypothetical protein
MEHTFLEYEGFTEKLLKIADEDDFFTLQWELEFDPEKGDLVRGLQGARKIRMAVRSQGKRGGARVIYYLRLETEIWLLDIYQKGSKSDLRDEDRKRILRAIARIKES